MRAPPFPARARIAAGTRETLSRKWVQRLLVWGAIIIAWEIFGRRVGPFFFASFTQTMGGLRELVVSGDIWVLGESIQQMLSGYLLAAVVGIPVGLLMGASRRFRHVLEPYVNLMFVASMEALLPFLIILFGVGFQFRTMVVFLFSVLYVVLNTQAGVRNIDSQLIETARSFRAPAWRIFKDVMLPGPLPYILAGLRLALGMALQGMIIAELWVQTQTGALLFGLAEFRALDRFLALVLVIMILGALATEALFWVQRKAAPWARDLATPGR